jgi:membrane protein involved in colicin uptake
VETRQLTDLTPEQVKEADRLENQRQQLEQQILDADLRAADAELRAEAEKAKAEAEKARAEKSEARTNELLAKLDDYEAKIKLLENASAKGEFHCRLATCGPNGFRLLFSGVMTTCPDVICRSFIRDARSSFAY